MCTCDRLSVLGDLLCGSNPPPRLVHIPYGERGGGGRVGKNARSNAHHHCLFFIIFFFFFSVTVCYVRITNRDSGRKMEMPRPQNIQNINIASARNLNQLK